MEAPLHLILPLPHPIPVFSLSLSWLISTDYTLGVTDFFVFYQHLPLTGKHSEARDWYLNPQRRGLCQACNRYSVTVSYVEMGGNHLFSPAIGFPATR